MLKQPFSARTILIGAVAVGLGAAAVAACLAMGTFRHGAGPTSQPPPATTASAPERPDFEVRPVSVSEGDAEWYQVPENSLPQRRAWPGELTAASNRLPRDAYVRVRRIDPEGDPNRTIVVRITDDGVSHQATIVDLSHPAAEALGMVKEGKVRVRVEVLALKNASSDKVVEKKDATPIAPKASDLTDKPVATEKQEQAAAAAKP